MQHYFGEYRRSHMALGLLAAGICVLAALMIARPLCRGAAEIGKSGRLVRSLGLTDLALFTEARYARHLSQADLHTAFQDHPNSLDHFPAGSILSPPPWRGRGMMESDLHRVLSGMSGGGYD